jgi:hypothetical protein
MSVIIKKTRAEPAIMTFIIFSWMNFVTESEALEASLPGVVPDVVSFVGTV